MNNTFVDPLILTDKTDLRHMSITSTLQGISKGEDTTEILTRVRYTMSICIMAMLLTALYG